MQNINDLDYQRYLAQKYKEQNGNQEKGKFAEGMKNITNGFVSGLSKLWNGLTGQTSANATLEANKMNIENQNYWNQMAMMREDTAHQREVADLQAAGLNPWLSAGGGAPASALSTAEAQPVDGSKILQTTSAMALLAVSKMISSIAARQRTIFRK